MKQKDVALIILIVALSALASYFISNIFFATKSDLKTEAEVVIPITAEFKEPDKRYFNNDSINPTRRITIGDENNQQPFNVTN